MTYKKLCHGLDGRCVLIHGAVSSTRGVAEFNTGVGGTGRGGGATDSGSLFEFKGKSVDQRLEGYTATLVRRFRLDDVLRYM